METKIERWIYVQVRGGEETELKKIDKERDTSHPITPSILIAIYLYMDDSIYIHYDIYTWIKYK